MIIRKGDSRISSMSVLMLVVVSIWSMIMSRGLSVFGLFCELLGVVCVFLGLILLVGGGMIDFGCVIFVGFCGCLLGIGCVVGFGLIVI